MSDTECDEPKKKNPLDSLPKSKMSLDAVKRGFNDHKKTDKKYFTSDVFVKEFDEAGFSVYVSHYKYNDDYTGRPDFVNRNAVNGLIQSLEDGRKYAFGSLCLMGGEIKQVVGYWVLRGDQPIKDVFEDFLDENTWTKLPFNQETFELLNQAFYGDVVKDKEVEHRSIFL